MIDEKLAAHKLWLESNKREGQQARFKGSELEGIDLRDVELRLAIFHGVNLEGVDLQNVDLQCTVFSNVNLQGANLQGANVTHASIARSDLSRACLTNADLRAVYLSWTNLGDVQVNGADFRNTNFVECSVENVDFRGAKLLSDDLVTTNVIFRQEFYLIICHDNLMKIGCQVATFDEWAAFSKNDIFEMHGDDATYFWRHKREFCLSLKDQLC